MVGANGHGCVDPGTAVIRQTLRANAPRQSALRQGSLREATPRDSCLMAPMVHPVCSLGTLFLSGKLVASIANSVSIDPGYWAAPPKNPVIFQAPPSLL